MLSSFPHLTSSEFEDGCNRLLKRFHRCSDTQIDWISLESIELHETRYLQITRNLTKEEYNPHSTSLEVEISEVEEHDDEEVLIRQAHKRSPIINYDIILSPSYRVPVLYISISDPQHRFPPTMSTLYEHLVPRDFKAQTEAVGVIGGITTTDHPFSNRPVFFVHPCQTAEAMEASVAEKNITAEEYLMIWIGALGKCVGLEVPLVLVRKDVEP